MGNRRMKKLCYFPAAIHECCGSTEVCISNSQEPGGHCSHFTFQLLSEKSRGKNVCLQASSLKWEQIGNVHQIFTYHSLGTVLQLGSFCWEKSCLLLGFLPWNTIFISLPVGLPVPADKGLVQAAGKPHGSGFLSSRQAARISLNSVFVDWTAYKWWKVYKLCSPL